MEFKLPRGMRDIEPEEYSIIEDVREAFKQTCKVFNFKMMEPSPLEMLSTLEAKGGLTIRDEIYYFKDKGDRELGLRFDLTVGVTRNITQKKGIALPVKIGTFGGMFRYDEPQYGRYRWFHQWNAEVYGEKELEAEAEIIDFTTFLCNKMGLKNITIKIGDRRLAEDFIRKELNESDSEQIKKLLRLLDKTNKKNDNEIIDEAKQSGILQETIVNLLEFGKTKDSPERLIENDKIKNIECKDIINLVELLNERNIKNIEIDFGLVRGLDYYSGLVFEVINNDDPGIGSIAGGGRYDKLPKNFGRSDLCAVGIAGGIERTISSLKGPSSTDNNMIYIAYTNSKFKKEILALAKQLREYGIPVSYDLTSKKLKRQFEFAGVRNCKRLILFADKEYSEEKVILRNMATGKETLVNKDVIVKTMLTEFDIN